MKSTIKISGMTCNGCKSTVESKLGSLDGVYDVQVDLTKSEAIIYSKNPISFSLISDSLPSKYNVIGNGHVQDNEIIKSSKIKQLKPLFIILGYILFEISIFTFTGTILSIAIFDSQI